MFNVHDISRDACMLHGPLRHLGYDWWWHSFTGKDEQTGEEKPFFIEFFVCNPALGGDEPILGQLPENITAEPYVNQMEVLAKSDLFLTHCGMNSASEGLYMGVPELLYPFTGEQQAVARRVYETGAGRMLSRQEANDPKTLRNVILNALKDPALKEGAEAMRQDFLSCSGPAGAADFIESRSS